jgi:hypothetical protein
MILQSTTSGDYIPHPEGIHPAVCVDVIDLGLRKSEFQGQVTMKNKLRLVFESEQKMPDGRNFTISKNFTASLHPKARLADFLGKWRGRPVVPGETIDFDKLPGACCTLVISHQSGLEGNKYASIDAISKPTKSLKASGYYDPAAARQRIAEWNAKQARSGQANWQQPQQQNTGRFNQQGQPMQTQAAPPVYYNQSGQPTQGASGPVIAPASAPFAAAPVAAAPAKASPPNQTNNPPVEEDDVPF